MGNFRYNLVVIADAMWPEIYNYDTIMYVIKLQRNYARNYVVIFNTPLKVQPKINLYPPQTYYIFKAECTNIFHYGQMLMLILPASCLTCLTMVSSIEICTFTSALIQIQWSTIHTQQSTTVYNKVSTNYFEFLRWLQGFNIIPFMLCFT